MPSWPPPDTLKQWSDQPQVNSCLLELFIIQVLQVLLSALASHLDQAWVELAAERLLELERQEVVLVSLVSLESPLEHSFYRTLVREGLLQLVVEKMRGPCWRERTMVFLTGRRPVGEPGRRSRMNHLRETHKQLHLD